MITKYDIGDRVQVKGIRLGVPGKYYSNVSGTVTSIHIDRLQREEYSIQLYYPIGSTVRGEDVSGMEVPCEQRFACSQIIGKENK